MHETQPTREQNPASDRSRKTTLNQSAALSATEPQHPLLSLQRTIGNRAVIDRLGLQRTPARQPQFAVPTAVAALPAKLQIGAVNDPLETEADRVADQVMRVSDAEARPAETDGKSDVRNAEQPLRRKEAGGISGASVTGAPGIVHDVLRSPGQPLDAGRRAYFEPRFGADFSHVRIHSDLPAADAARSVAAEAFTVGDHVVFGDNQYAPGNAEGGHLLAHELTHVVQQRAGGAALQRRPANCPAGPPLPPTITTMDDFIALVKRVENSTMTGGDPIETARLISRTKYEGTAWDWMLPSTKGQSGVSKDSHDVGQVKADDVGSLCFKLIVSLPGGGMEDPMHVIVAIVADAETKPAGTGATGLSRAIDPLPASVSQRGATTWVGDVGKAAGDWMAVRSPANGGRDKSDHMLDSAPPHDLMADVDGVAITSKSSASGFALDKTKTLSENLKRFFSPAKGTGRERRFHVFCSAEGFTFEADGVTLTAASKKAIGQKVKDFADWYTRNDPHVVAYVAMAARGSFMFSKALVDRGGDWQWFADQFIDFVQKGLTAEGR